MGRAVVVDREAVQAGVVHRAEAVRAADLLPSCSRARRAVRRCFVPIATARIMLVWLGKT